MLTYVYVGIGGLIGSLLRFFLYSFSVFLWGNTFPFGTLITNILGACLLGIFTNKYAQHKRMSEKLKLAISTGAIGSFTTLSTLSTDTVHLLNTGSILFAFLYVLLSLTGGLAGIYISGFKSADKDREAK